MCVIVYKPKGVDIDMEKLQLCWEHNKHGAGLMFAEDGVLRVAKGFMKWRSFKRYIKRTKIKRLNKLPVVFHFRIATHGSIDPRNCHPFQMNDSLAMAHNGVMQNIGIPEGEDISDSEAFLNRYVRDAFSSISIDALSNGMPINELFSKFIGSSKLVFMDNDGDVAIVNEGAGTWLEGTWHSNMLWKPYVKKTRPTKGALNMTPWNPSLNYGPRMDATQLGVNSPEDLDDWYCFDCRAYFALGEARRSYWTNGMKDRIVDCPECTGPNTTEVCESMFDDQSEELDRWSIQWSCYDCVETFDEDSTVMEEVGGESRCVCPFCAGVNTYESEYQDMVDRFGASFFSAQSHDLTRGGADA